MIGSTSASGSDSHESFGPVTDQWVCGRHDSCCCAVGGLVGLNSDGDITNSYPTASVSENAWFRVSIARSKGGLVGDNDVEQTSYSYAKGNVAINDDIYLTNGNSNGAGWLVEREFVQAHLMQVCSALALSSSAF